jgi:ABC-type iron transport system FetAB permease component
MVGYVLAYIFSGDSSLIALVVRVIIITATSWIALNTIEVTSGLYTIPRFGIAF